METAVKYSYPDTTGHYGEFGGMYVPPSIQSALFELDNLYKEVRNTDEFINDLEKLQKEYNGRPTPLTYADRLTELYGKAKIYLKREDLCHTGAHKLNNCLGQILLAKKLGKNRVIAETGAGQHGVATATVCAKFGLQCTIYMGAIDCERQKLNVFRMKMLGAEVIPVTQGGQTLTDAVDAALADWITSYKETFYLLGSAVGPYPFPSMVKDFQSVIGKEAKAQILKSEGRLPDYVMACVGGGSNAIGIFSDFIEDESVKLIGVEAAGLGIDTDKHAATMTLGKPGMIHGMKTYLLEGQDGSPYEVYSISAGLDYPGVGPEHSLLKDIKRAEYYAVTDKEALDATVRLSKYEGILPALESAHAIAYLEHLMPNTKEDEIVIVNVSGRGDKDLNTIVDELSDIFA